MGEPAPIQTPVPGLPRGGPRGLGHARLQLCHLQKRTNTSTQLICFMGYCKNQNKDDSMRVRAQRPGEQSVGVTVHGAVQIVFRLMCPPDQGPALCAGLPAAQGAPEPSRAQRALARDGQVREFSQQHEMGPSRCARDWGERGCCCLARSCLPS